MSSNLFLPRKSVNELIEVQCRLGRSEYPAIETQKLHVCHDAHWVYHRDYAAADLNPIPSQPSVALA
jgi:hypothetical protein